MQNPLGLLLCADLFSASRITTTARARGLEVVSCRTVEALFTQVEGKSPTGLLLDLHQPGLDLPAFLQQVRERCPTMPRVVAFGSHVEAALLRAARQAGCDLVLPRSAFFERLEADLPQWLAP